MRNLAIPALLSGGLLAAALPAAADSGLLNLLTNPSTIAVYGDAPYGTTPTDTSETDATPAFIAAVKADPDVSLVRFVQSKVLFVTINLPGGSNKGAAHQAAYEPYVSSIASHTLAFGKPVLLLNGDSHVYLSDNPLSASDPLAFMHAGYDVPNFHRIVVHGSTFPLEYLKLTVDPRANFPQGPDAFGPFSWTRVMP